MIMGNTVINLFDFQLFDSSQRHSLGLLFHNQVIRCTVLRFSQVKWCFTDGFSPWCLLRHPLSEKKNQSKKGYLVFMLILENQWH